MPFNQNPVRPDTPSYPDPCPANKPLLGDLYISLPLKVGKHEWRIVIFVHPSYGNCTRYEWRRLVDPKFDKPGLWKQEDDWPHSPRSRDSFWGGLPKSLVKLYRANEDIVRDHIAR